jgi:hypothetical protein
MGDPRASGRITSTWVLKKVGVKMTGFSWLKVESSDE